MLGVPINYTRLFRAQHTDRLYNNAIGMSILCVNLFALSRKKVPKHRDFFNELNPFIGVYFVFVCENLDYINESENSRNTCPGNQNFKDALFGFS